MLDPAHHRTQGVRPADDGLRSPTPSCTASTPARRPTFNKQRLEPADAATARRPSSPTSCGTGRARASRPHVRRARGQLLERRLIRDLGALRAPRGRAARAARGEPLRGLVRRRRRGAGAQGRPADRRLRRGRQDRPHRHRSRDVLGARAHPRLQGRRDRQLGRAHPPRGRPPADPAVPLVAARAARARARRRPVPGARSRGRHDARACSTARTRTPITRPASTRTATSCRIPTSGRAPSPDAQAIATRRVARIRRGDVRHDPRGGSWSSFCPWAGVCRVPR